MHLHHTFGNSILRFWANSCHDSLLLTCHLICVAKLMKLRPAFLTYLLDCLRSRQVGWLGAWPVQHSLGYGSWVGICHSRHSFPYIGSWWLRNTGASRKLLEGCYSLKPPKADVPPVGNWRSCLIVAMTLHFEIFNCFFIQYGWVISTWAAAVFWGHVFKLKNTDKLYIMHSLSAYFTKKMNSKWKCFPIKNLVVMAFNVIFFFLFLNNENRNNNPY